MSYEKDTAPLERAKPPKTGFFNGKRIAVLLSGVATIGILAAWGMTVRGDETEEIKVSEVAAANINVSAARPQAYAPPSDPDPPADNTVKEEPRQNTGGGTQKRRGPPDGFKKVSPVVMRGNNKAVAQSGGQQQVMQANHTNGNGGAYPGQEGYEGGYSQDDGGYGGGARGQRRSNKESFYAGGGAAGGGDLDVKGELMPELQGCVVKAGTQIMLQTRSKVRTALPQKVLGYVVNPVEGNHYLGNGQVERCIAIRAGSTVLSEINASGVERGDLRIQACALRLDLLGGGRRPLGCQPAHGADGGAGIEADSDYQWGGIATGILIEAAFASARGLTGLIGGPAGIAVQVGTQGVSEVGSEYVRRELMKPPVLTMEAGAIWGIQLNGDLSLPID